MDLAGNAHQIEQRDAGWPERAQAKLVGTRDRDGAAQLAPVAVRQSQLDRVLRLHGAKGFLGAAAGLHLWSGGAGGQKERPKKFHERQSGDESTRRITRKVSTKP